MTRPGHLQETTIVAKKQGKPIGFINGLTRKAAMRYYKDLGGPVALGLYLCLKYHDDASACSHKIDPNQYICSGDFRTDYLASKLLSKYRDGPEELQVELKNKAVEKFLLTEKRLRSHLPRLNHLLYGVPNNLEDVRSSRVLYTAREKIGKWLGSFWEAFDPLDCEFGPGASTSVPGLEAHPANKFIAKEASAYCKRWVDQFMSYLVPGTQWNTELVIRDSSRMSIVDKNFDNKRTIACEPDWNIFFQKGCGAALRKRLRRLGLDLDYASDRHQLLARIASRDGDLCTVDLSAASDSILRALVRFLLPDDWFYALDSLRTPFVELPKDESKALGVEPRVPLVKFSSMGNGFTFELESLIFYAIAVAACEVMEVETHDVSCFGDDIIIPVAAFEALQGALCGAGFLINTDKSYSTGYFRESCGAHFFDGWDTKPVFLRNKLDHDTEKYKFCNALRASTVRCFGTSIHSHRLRNTYRLIVDTIRELFHIPDGIGDGGLVSTFDEAAPSFRSPTRRRKNGRPERPNARCLSRLTGKQDGAGWEGYRLRVWLPIARKEVIDHEGQMDAAHYTLRRSFNRRQRCCELGHSNQVRNYGVLSRCYSRDEITAILKYHRDTFVVAPDQTEATSLRKKRTASSEDEAFEGVYSMRSSTTHYRVGHVVVPHWTDPEG